MYDLKFLIDRETFKVFLEMLDVDMAEWIRECEIQEPVKTLDGKEYHLAMFSTNGNEEKKDKIMSLFRDIKG